MMPTDMQLQQAVLAELNWDPSLAAGKIGIVADAGVVTLSGSVASFAERHTAATAARRVNGVLSVAEEIEVQLPLEHRRSDTDLEAASIERLAWDVALPLGAVIVAVDHGWVTLSGRVDWHYQSQAAFHDIGGLMGVVGITDRIMVNSNPIATTTRHRPPALPVARFARN
jgi:osmotically-inducible protein OsmY